MLDAAELVPAGAVSRTARFVGAEHGAGASFFYVDNDPGQGPPLHWHPYTETWVVIDGEVEFTVGNETVRATAGAITTAPAEVPHKFVNVGTGRLRMMCVHASPEIIQFDLE